MPRINIGTKTGSEKKPIRSSKKDAASNASAGASVSAEMNFNNDFEHITHSLSEVSHMIESLQPSSKFENSCKSILQILNKHVLLLSTSCSAMAGSVDAVETNIAKTDQYSRRDTVVVTGVDYKPETETYNSLSDTVAEEMRKSGVQVSSSDFSACHRNGKKHKQITRNGKTTKVPPSITVRFYSSYKKDNLLFRYKNYENNKPKKVKIVQSLNNHYHQLKGSISNFCSENDIGVKWIHWRSSSAGLCIKLDDDRIVSKIHSMTDFNNLINSC